MFFRPANNIGLCRSKVSNPTTNITISINSFENPDNPPNLNDFINFYRKKTE